MHETIIVLKPFPKDWPFAKKNKFARIIMTGFCKNILKIQAPDKEPYDDRVYVTVESRYDPLTTVKNLKKRDFYLEGQKILYRLQKDALTRAIESAIINNKVKSAKSAAEELFVKPIQVDTVPGRITDPKTIRKGNLLIRRHQESQTV